MSLSNYPPGVSGNEPEINGEPECAECGFPMSLHQFDSYESDGYEYEVVVAHPTPCSQCGGEGGFMGVADNMDITECPDCNGTGVRPGD